MWGSRQTAEEERGAIGKENHDYLDMYVSNNRSNALSEGGNPDGEGTASSDGKGNSNGTEPKEQPPDEAETSDDGDGNLHVVLNYIEGSQKDADKYTTPSIQALIKKYGVKPLPPERQTFDRSADYLVKCLYPKFIEDYNAATGRNVGDPNQVDAQTKADIDEYVKKSNVQLQDQQEAQQNVNTALGSIRY